MTEAREKGGGRVSGGMHCKYAAVGGKSGDCAGIAVMVLREL